MRKSFLTVVSLLALFLCSAVHARAQQANVAEREAEWNQLVLPQTTFARQTDPAKTILFRIPSEWTQPQSDKLNFSGPHGATLGVFVEKIPDGIPLRDYVSAVMQPLRSMLDDPDAMVMRRTSMSGLEAREMIFESDEGTQEMSRRIIWCTVSGPNAISMVLIEPTAKVAEIEPYFKAIVQSVTFVDKSDYTAFDALRLSAIKDIKPTRVDEVQSLAASFAALDDSARHSNISRLAAIFAASPDTAVDLALDSRPMVRAAAVEAIVQSQDARLEEFVRLALKDKESFVAQNAARSIAANPNVISLLRSASFEWFNIEPVARVWPFLSRKNQIKILDEIFAQPLVPAPPDKPSVSSTGKPRVTVRATVVSPGSKIPAAVVQPLTPTSEPSRQLNALTLIRDLPVAEFKLPLGAILAAKHDELTTLALQVVWVREELVPAAELLKLLSSSNSEVRRLAALNLGQSGTVADIKSIQDHIAKAAPAAKSSPGVVGDSKPIDPPIDPMRDNLEITISKIRLRAELDAASGDVRRQVRQQIIQKGLADPRLAEWVWYRFVRNKFDDEHPKTGSTSQPHAVKILPLGENIFPKDVTYYAALPQPAAALDKFGSALEGLQLESARSQANLVLILSALREQFAQQLDSPPGASPLLFSGINTQQPIALASWFAEGAPRGIQSAERKAIVLRVTDRARFERTLTLYQRSLGDFEGLTDYFSGGIRFVTLLPAFLPLTAKAMLAGIDRSTPETPFLKYGFVGETEWHGYPIKVIEQRSVDSTGHLERDSAYLTYLGDTAVLAPNLDSLRDVLLRSSNQTETLASNPNFKQLTEKPGEAIYLSNLTQLAAGPTDNANPANKAVVSESGALKVSNLSWENLYELRFDQRDWLKPFIGFKPEELKSPRELLPQTTVAYYFMNLDVVAGWRDWSRQLFSAEELRELTATWAIDYEKEVLPELGPECGVAVLGLPNILSNDWDVPMAVFFKLKSDKLARVFAVGKMFGASSAAGEPMLIKHKAADFFVVVKGNFLVIANSRSAIAALDQPEKLINSRDFSRAAKGAPAGVVAFGGYNLEAASAAIGDFGSDPIKAQQSSLISSLANAFHSPNFYATLTSDAVQGRFSLSMDREGRFSVSDLTSLSKDYRLTYAHLEPRGVPIQNQERLSSLRLRIRAKAAGEIDRIGDDVSSPYQTAKKLSEQELDLRILPRHSEPKTTLTLPISGPELSPYLKPDNESRSDDQAVVEKARSIAGEEKDAWKVARQLADWTYKNIKWKRVDNATAPQTLATLEADCLEFSQLYVAMARSLGLPARIVSGLAYSGASFGGHAWVEVYVGEWIEVDPTWGTDFVDATHIRDSTKGALLTYAALNLVEVEVLEAPREVSEFQKDPLTLAKKLCLELPKGNLTALTSALDIAVLTNESTGLGTWESLSDAERELMSSAYRRVLLEIGSGYRDEQGETGEWRLLQVKEKGERAEALVIQPGFDGELLRLSFVRRDGAWMLTEILQADSDLHLVSETLQPTVKRIVDRRGNKPAVRQSTSDFVRILIAMQKDAKTAIPIADRALQDDPKNHGLRHLKALALAKDEKGEDAIRLLEELAYATPPFAPALRTLANYYEGSDDAHKTQKAIAYYQLYGELVPEDPRTHGVLASLYETNNDNVLAEAEYRAALKSDPRNVGQFMHFAIFLALGKRFQEVESVIAEVEKVVSAGDDFFGDLMRQVAFIEDRTIPEEFARSQPARMGKSAQANLYLGYVLLNNGKSLQAMPLLKQAAALKIDWAEPYVAMAQGYRNLKNWTAALNAADTAIRLDADDADAHFQRACALARLGRTNEALRSLEKAVTLDSELREDLSDESDLKTLAAQPGFKKLMVVPEEAK